MGLLNGAVALCRYRLIGVEGRPSLQELNRKLARYQARHIKLEASPNPKEERAGWVLPPLPELEDWPVGGAWDMSHCQFGEGFLLRLRIERRKVPTELLQLVCRQGLAGADSQLSRQQQRELRQQTREELLAQALPSLSYIDAFWAADNTVMLFTIGKKNRELFEHLFHETFAEPLGSSLCRVDPPLLALSREEWEHQGESSEGLDRLAPLLPQSAVASV